VRRRDVDSVDVRVFDKGFVASVSARDCEPIAEFIGRCLCARADGHYRGVWEQPHVRRESSCDSTGADDSPSERPDVVREVSRH
jgi:hypothetical protein